MTHHYNKHTTSRHRRTDIHSTGKLPLPDLGSWRKEKILGQRGLAHPIHFTGDLASPCMFLDHYWR